MRWLIVLLAGVCLMVSNTVLAQVEDDQMTDVPKIERMGSYLVVEHVATASEFYRELFGLEPEYSSPVFVSFNIAGGQFALAARSVFSPRAEIGDNGVPNMKVADIDAMFDHVLRMAPESLVSTSIEQEGPIALFKLRDPDGNLVEFYSLSSVSTSSSSD
ncbi:MAG: VOC family protein [Erythrobacter sp.]